jgi:hypothetical protein
MKNIIRIWTKASRCAPKRNIILNIVSHNNNLLIYILFIIIYTLFIVIYYIV